MKLKIYQVDAFSKNIFEGNPAAVVPLKEWLSDKIMQNIAVENNLSETAFFISKKDYYHIRWFTPNGEVKLCGHATLASAYVIFNFFNYKLKEIYFKSLSGILKVQFFEGKIILDFPCQNFIKCKIPKLLITGLNKIPKSCFFGEDYMAVFDSEDEISNIYPQYEILKKMKGRGVIITAPGKNYDFVSRAFFPKFDILEDPVTGSSHTMLIPYWKKRLNKKKLKGKQISKRGGELFCEMKDKRVLISGYAKLYMIGMIYI